MADDRNDPFGDEQFPDLGRDEGDFGERPSSSGGRGWKIALIVIGVSALVIILCCGGLSWFGYQWAQEQMQMTRNPEEIRAWTDEAITIDIPADYTPEDGTKFGMGAFMTYTVLLYSGPEGSQLFFVEVSGRAASDPQNQAQLEPSLRDGIQGRAKVIQEESSKIHEIEINGQSVDFKLITGAETVSGDEWSELSGVVPTDRGMVLVVIQAPAESFDKEEALSMMKSIEMPE